MAISGGSRRAIVRSLSRCWISNTFRQHLGAPPQGWHATTTHPYLCAVLFFFSFSPSRAPRVHCSPRAFRTARHPHSKRAFDWRQVRLRSRTFYLVCPCYQIGNCVSFFFFSYLRTKDEFFVRNENFIQQYIIHFVLLPAFSQLRSFHFFQSAR